MIQVLYIARYRGPAMEAKIEALSRQQDLSVCLLRPGAWSDDYGEWNTPAATSAPYRTLAVPLVGRPDDPHRTLYAKADLGLLSFQADIIHAEEEPDSLAALQISLARRFFAPRARLVLHTWQNVNRRKSSLVRQVLRIALSQSSAVLCASQGAFQVLRELGYGTTAAVIPPYGVDTRLFRPAASTTEDRPFTALFAGRFVPEKGLDVLLDAFSMLRGPAQLVLVGDGPLRRAVERRIEETGLVGSVDLAGPLPAGLFARRLQAADALVLPSRGTAVWQEQFGRVLVEAMACRVPVVGSDSGAIPEVIGDAGLLFPEGDAARLAACLANLMNSPGLRRDLAERGYGRVIALYSAEQVAGRTADFYRGLLQ